MPPSPKVRSHQIAALLEAAVEQFHRDFHRDRDPVSFAHRYRTPADREVVAFLCALLAYGNVRAILQSCTRLLEALGDRPAERIRDGLAPGALPVFRHRFTKSTDLELILAWLTQALREHGSLEGRFLAGRDAASPMRDRLGAFVDSLWATPVTGDHAQTKAARAPQLKHLVSHPARGSACKRLNLFLRWMVRPPDGVDLGLWTRVSPAALVLPVDTHLLKVLRELRWTRSKAANWKVAESATDRLRAFSANDPVRFDFALCHLSMQGLTLAEFLRNKGRHTNEME